MHPRLSGHLSQARLSSDINDVVVGPWLVKHARDAIIGKHDKATA